MKIFDTGEGGFSQKVNFVDENNVMLGYDMDQSCCENADWFIADVPMDRIVERKGVPDMAGYVFDTAFFKEVKGDGAWDGELDEGGIVIFRLVGSAGEKFLHLFNCHNGYYSHGFEFSVDGVQMHTGSL